MIYLALIPAAALAIWIVYRSQNSGFMVNDLRGKLPTAPGKQYARRGLSIIERIIIHHSATSGGGPEDFARYHVDNHGWPGIGYHYVIDQAGRIFQTQDWETVSYHCSGQNSNSLGICLVGNFSRTQPTEKQYKALEYLVSFIRTDLNNQLGTNKKLTVYGHKDFKATDCPGANFNLSKFNV